MGGNALSIPSIRLPAARYFQVAQQVIATLRQAFPARRIESIVAYGSKADFGDLDILVEATADYAPQAMASALQASEIVYNGDVTSIGLPLAEGLFQVDLIRTPGASFDFCVRYFGFNDMGNLLGRIAHKFGAKFGHQSLLYPLRDPDNGSQMIAEIPVTTDFSLALQLLGFDAARYEELRQNGGFHTLEDIFRYVVSSPYANRDIYLLENRNHASRIRDAKRPTYNAFLRWLDAQPPGSLPAFPWAAAGSEAREQQRQMFLDAAFATCPAFRQAYQHTMAELARKKSIRQRFNGTMVAAITGLSGKLLGQVMTQVRNSFANEAAFEQFMLHASDEAVTACILQHVPPMPTHA